MQDLRGIQEVVDESGIPAGVAAENRNIWNLLKHRDPDRFLEWQRIQLIKDRREIKWRPVARKLWRNDRDLRFDALELLQRERVTRSGRTTCPGDSGNFICATVNAKLGFDAAVGKMTEEEEKTACDWAKANWKEFQVKRQFHEAAEALELAHQEIAGLLQMVEQSNKRFVELINRSESAIHGAKILMELQRKATQDQITGICECEGDAALREPICLRHLQAHQELLRERVAWQNEETLHTSIENAAAVEFCTRNCGGAKDDGHDEERVEIGDLREPRSWLALKRGSQKRLESLPYLRFHIPNGPWNFDLVHAPITGSSGILLPEERTTSGEPIVPNGRRAE